MSPRWATEDEIVEAEILGSTEPLLIVRHRASDYNVVLAKIAYVEGRIDVDELERWVERALLGGEDVPEPIPAGWILV